MSLALCRLRTTFEQQPGGEDDQHDGGDLEEQRQRDAPSAEVDEEGERAGDGEADQARRSARRGPSCSVAAARRNSAASMPSRSTATNATPASANPALLRARAASTFCSSSPLIEAALAAHPEDHPREHAGGDERDGGERPQPLDAFERSDRLVDDDADDQRDGHGGGHAQPDRHGQVGALEAAQVGEDDGDDQGALEPLTDHDQQCGLHRLARVPTIGRSGCLRADVERPAEGGRRRSLLTQLLSVGGRRRGGRRRGGRS